MTDMPAPMPERLVYAVGDIHGRRDLLDQMLDLIRSDARGAEADLVFLGDYIDRGPDSAAVLARLRTLQVENMCVTCLMGNHERMLLSFLEDPDRNGDIWLRHGGTETVADFVSGRARATHEGSRLQSLRDSLMAALGDDLLTWLQARPLSFLTGNIGCVHGMADPALPWEQQEEHTLLWGRISRERRSREDGIWVVHGHTVIPRATQSDGLVSVDTGAYKSGVLSAVRCEAGDVRFLTTSDAPQ